MSTSTHVVLGGNGVIGQETVRALLRHGANVDSVGRQPATIAAARSITADLLDATAVANALAGAEVAYLTAGLPHSARVWAKQWPIIVRNTIEAAIAHRTHLVYFDNVYAYGRVDGEMNEQTSIHPNSKKGRVRAAALHALDHAAGNRGLVYTVGRSADFYGPGAKTSAFNTFALDKIAAGKPGTWLFDADQPHSLTYTSDIGDALRILGTDQRARGQVWHLPTAPARTGRAYIELVAGADCKTMSRNTVRMGALFNTDARETLEMSYQYTAPYQFASRAFGTTFAIAPTPHEEGIATTLAAAQRAI